jgi:hypothetical protein
MATKKELIAQEVAPAVGAGKAVALETVDFNDPNRPKTCLEVDFPILPVNHVAIIEGNSRASIHFKRKILSVWRRRSARQRGSDYTHRSATIGGTEKRYRPDHRDDHLEMTKAP